MEYDYINYYSDLLRRRIYELRTEKKLSERKLSFELGKSTGYVSNISIGAALPRLEHLFELCEYFHITPAEFFAEDTTRSDLIRNQFADALMELDDGHKERLNAIVEEIGMEAIERFIDTLYEYKHGAPQEQSDPEE